MTILNLYQSFCEKLSEKNLECHFWPFQIYTSLSGKNCQKNLEFFEFWIYTSLFGKNFRKKIGMPFLTILNLYQSFWEKLSEKIWNAIFDHSEFIPVFLGKIVRKNLEWPYHFWPLSEFIPVYLGKIVRKKFRMAIFGHSKFIPVFWEKLSEKIQNSHFWPFWIYTSLFGKNCQKN